LTFHARQAETPPCHRAVDGSAELRLRMEAWLATSVDQIISTTSAECRALVAAGVAPRRISVIPDGVDLSSFRPDGPRWPDRRLPHRVVCLSGLAPHKGVADLVEAVAGLPDVELLIAGGPPRRMLAEDACARDLSAMIEASGTAGRIVLLGAVDRARLPGLLRSADVVACTPWYEPVRTVALEAMACGVPVVATGAGGLAEPVVDGRTGILVPRRMRSIQAAIATLLCQPARRIAMGRAGVRRASNYGWDDVAARTLRVVERLIAEAASVRPSADLPPRSCPRRTVVAPTRRRDVTEHHRIPFINALGGTRAD
jgi:D-inositol-3-phosphate glycosyltransferase